MGRPKRQPIIDADVLQNEIDFYMERERKRKATERQFKIDRSQEFAWLKSAGLTNTAIGNLYELSRETVRQELLFLEV